MTNGILPTSITPQAGAKPAGQVVQIVSLPEALQNNARAVRLEGEVVAQNQDGSTRVKTAEGSIDISFRGKQPQPGTKLEVDIPAGAPPRSATVRPAPPQVQPLAQAPIDKGSPPLPSTPVAQTLNLAQQPAGTPSSPPSTHATSAATSSTQTAQQTATAPQAQAPLSSTYQPPQKTSAPAPAPQPLSQGQVVRLAPLPPVQAQVYITQSTQQAQPQSSVSATLSRIAYKADLIVSEVAAQTSKLFSSGSLLTKAPLQTLVDTKDSGTAFTTTQAKTFFQSTAPEKNFDISFLPSSAGEQKIQAPLASVFTALSKTSTIKNILSSLGLFTKADAAGTTPTPTAPSFVSSALPSPKLSFVDIQILDIKPPPTTLQSPHGFIPSAPASGPAPSSPFFSQAPHPNTLQAAPSAPPVITGVVTGFAPQNMPLVHVPWASGGLSQNLVLQFSASNVDVGTQILFSLTNIQSAQSTSAATTKPIFTPPLMQASPFWPVMDDLFQSLAQIPAPAAQMFARIMPTPTSPSNLGSAALLFIASVRAGDITGWLGEKRTDLLIKAGKDILIKRLAQDAGQISQANADTPSSDWRSYPLPLLWQNEISKAMLHIKHEQEQESRDHKEGATRFVMDVSLSRMGDVQLEGMFHGKRLDLLVRTQMPISLSMQEAMKRAYAQALQNTDVYGELGFQGDIKGWVNVLKNEEKLALSS